MNPTKASVCSTLRAQQSQSSTEDKVAILSAWVVLARAHGLMACSRAEAPWWRLLLLTGMLT